uniref:Beta-N-acetylhexosaminidase n=1 Tax=Globodera rostochiensis TaxID=31243 RepID=A0A914H4S7_GLORO
MHLTNPFIPGYLAFCSGFRSQTPLLGHFFHYSTLGSEATFMYSDSKKIKISNFVRNVRFCTSFNSRLVGFLICIFLILIFAFYNLFDLELEFENKMSSPVILLTKSTSFKRQIVHLDLKGAAPKPHYLLELFQFFKKLGFTTILMEYEDMFPYKSGLSVLARKTAYNETTIEQLKESANAIGLDFIPLVQTFGHLEFALKHQEFSSLREDPNWLDTICPSNERSIWLIREMIAQVRHIHPDEKAIHIGCDEAWHIGLDRACQLRLNTLNGSIDRLKLEHISRIARMAKEEFGFDQVFAWNDMFDKIPVSLLEEYELGSLLIPVVWGYSRDVTRPGYFPSGLFERYSHIFEEIYFAGAFKGANGVTQQFVDIERYMQNLRSYQELYFLNEEHLKNRLTGIILTGWQRFSHNKPLCELLPASIPSLAREAIFLSEWRNGKRPEEQMNERLREILNCSKSPLAGDFAHKGAIFPFVFEVQLGECQFPGVELYREIEKLNVLRWQAMREHNMKAEIEEEFNNAKKRMVILLDHFFYEDTVNEWLTQHSYLSDFKDDDPNVPRFDPIL